MNILIVSQHFYPETFRINDIAFSFAEMGHNVTVLTGLPNYPTGIIPKNYRLFKNRKEHINGVNILRTSIFSRRKNIFSMALNYLSFCISSSFKAYMLKESFDIIFSFQTSPISMVLPAILVKFKQKIPLVIHCLDQWPISVTTGPISSDSHLYKILFYFSKWIYLKANLITLSSKSFQDYFINTLNINKDKGLVYWPAYAEDIYLTTNQKSNNTFDLVFAGNVGPAQNVEMIVQVAHKLMGDSEIQFHIVGDGLSLEKCQLLAKQLKLNNIHFYGHHAVDEMPKYFQLADVFLITMIDNPVVNQTLPAKIQSYMLASRPILGAINGEVRNVIEDANCGLVCASDDIDTFVENIKLAKNNPDKLKEWSENAYTYYQKHFDKETLLNQMLALFNNLIERK